ncbi:MAG: hypothetical protein U0R72_04390 [Nakamurella multipartita]|jgi:uncharacterized membrane protein
MIAGAAQAAQDGGLFGDGFGVGTILLIAGMVLSVAVVSGLGFIARMNDRSAERKSVRPPTDTAADTATDTAAERSAEDGRE